MRPIRIIDKIYIDKYDDIIVEYHFIDSNVHWKCICHYEDHIIKNTFVNTYPQNKSSLIFKCENLINLREGNYIVLYNNTITAKYNNDTIKFFCDEIYPMIVNYYIKHLETLFRQGKIGFDDIHEDFRIQNVMIILVKKILNVPFD